MNGKEVINTSELRSISSSMKSKKDLLLSIYKDSIKPLLLESEQVIIKSKLDFTEVDSSFKELFSLLDKNISELTDVLVNKIIPNYENLSGELNQLFMNDLGSKLEELLDVKE